MKLFLNHICLSLSEETHSGCLLQLGDSILAELRLDLSKMSPDEISDLTTRGQSWIVSVREEFLQQVDFSEKFLAAQSDKVRYVDFDFSLLKNNQAMKLLKMARTAGMNIMFSSHHLVETPPPEVLKSICFEMAEAGADAIKIVCKANSEEDVAAVRLLYSDFENITAFCFDEIGRETRIEALFRGLKISYAYPDNAKRNAPGQYSFSEMIKFAESAWRKGLFNE